MHEERKTEMAHGTASTVPQRARALIEPLASAHGLEIVDVEWSGRVLRIVIDRPEGAGEVSVDDCTRLSRDVSTALDVEDFIAKSYSLEVSSPGLDRPLRSARDFRRHVGKLCKVKLREPAVDGQRVLRGRLLDVGDATFRIEVDKKHHEVAIDNVAEARLVIEFGPADGKKGRPRKQ
jgi:ribosome maturation factor RimP